MLSSKLIARGGLALSSLPAIGDAVYGGYMAGVIDTTRGNIAADDFYQTGAKYLLIVSPKSLENSYIQIRGSYTETGMGCKTRWNGFDSSEFMWTQSQSIPDWVAITNIHPLAYPMDGGSCWYIPAMDELTLMHRNFKAVSNANSLSPGVPWPSPADGSNPSSDPIGAAFALTDPEVSSSELFRTGGSQRLGLSYGYWSSTRCYAGVNVIVNAGTDGFITSNRVDYGYSIRPIRRVVIL